MIISIAGPLTNIIIFIIAFFLKINNDLKTEIIYINAIIAIFNLIPIHPLDGSRIFKNLFKLYIGNKKAYEYTNIISNTVLIIFTIFCSVFILYAKNIAILLILIYLWLIAINENKCQKIRTAIYEKIN